MRRATQTSPFDPVASPGGATELAATRHVVTIPPGAGGRLDRALADAIPVLSRARIKALIEAGLVREAERTIDDPSARVKPGRTFTIEVPPATPAAPEPQAMDLAIVYEDEALLVVDKPAGLVVHPAPGNPDRTLVNALIAHCGATLSGIGGVARPGIVHRLDKDTSGLMVVAKTDAAHKALSAQFADRSLSRTYLAVVRGHPTAGRGRIEGSIGRDPRHRQRMAVVRTGGKPATTLFRLIEPLEQAALLECDLLTGRTHQIRVHLASLGLPIVGDALYGGRPRGEGSAIALIRTFPRQALHAARIRFIHPTDGRERRFSSPLPADMRDLVAGLGGRIADYT